MASLSVQERLPAIRPAAARKENKSG